MNRIDVRVSVARVLAFAALAVTAIGLLLPVSERAATPLTTVLGGTTIGVTVSTDPPPDGTTLSFRWIATDGVVANLNSPSSTWTLPSGQGLHFLYVLVSNSKGGYTEKRLAISTVDPLATSSAIVQGTPLPPIPQTPPSGVPQGMARSWIDDFRPDIAVKLYNLHTGTFQGPVTTDLKGQFVFYDVPKGTYVPYVLDGPGLLFRQATGWYTSLSLLKVNSTDAVSLYPVGPSNLNSESINLVRALDRPGNVVVSGKVQLSDSSPCGVRSPLFGLEVTSTAELVNASNTLISGPVRANAFNIFELDATVPESGAYRVRVRCEQVPVQEAALNITLNPPQTLVFKGVNVTVPSTAPLVHGFTATLNGQPIDVSSAAAGALPSDSVPLADQFLTTKGLDSRQGACQYYRAIGVVASCDANGTPSGGITFDAWKKDRGLAPYNTGAEFEASYVNQVDLNLTRNHHGVAGANGVAMYVCNYPGPVDTSAAGIDTAVDNAVNNRNLVACVGMDYAAFTGVNGGSAFTRFLTFGPSGNLLLSVNLDGRGEKFLPGVCVGCHGGDKYVGRYPSDGSGLANIGAHFLPFDTANFAFSTANGRTLFDQAAQIRQLNQLVMQTNATIGAQNLINGWYASGSSLQDNAYVGPGWTSDPRLYDGFIKRSCRTCHIAFPRYDTEAGLPCQGCVVRDICGGASDLPFNHWMPNSKVTFDRMWATRGTANDQVALMQSLLDPAHPGRDCRAQTPDNADLPTFAPGVPSYQRCDYTLSPPAPFFLSAAAQTKTVILTASNPSCSWYATGAPMTINGVSWFVGQGTTTLTLDMPANTSTAPQRFQLAIADDNRPGVTYFGFTQAAQGATCAYIIDPTVVSPGPAGGGGTVTISTGADCPWTASSNASWLTSLSPPSGTGPGAVTYSISANPLSAPRTGTLTVAGTTFTVNQSFIPIPPSLVITETHSGNFFQGQTGAVYTVTVSNAESAGPTTGVVTLTEMAPNGLTIASMDGFGWTCATGGTTCTRSDPLAGGASYPDITVRVNVGATATSPQVNAVNVSGGGSLSANATDSTIIVGVGTLRFVPVTPCRVADTRKTAAPFGGPAIFGGSSRDFNIPNSACGVPSNAKAYSFNVAVVPSGPLGFLTLWPSGQTRPAASTLNSLDGRVKSNAAIVTAGTGGSVSVFASNATDVVLDINGYFVLATDPTALAFFPVTPCRLVDTRKPTGPLAGPLLTGGQSRTFPILSGTCNLPAAARAYSLNFAAVPGGPLGFLTAWPTGQSRPQASSLNAVTGTVTANAVIVRAGTDGAIDVFASNDTNLVIDVNGYFAPMSAGGLSLYGVTPCRVVDTRQPPGSPPTMLLDVDFPSSACGIPATVQAVVLSVTAVPPGPLGFLTLWQKGQVRPVVSTLNALDGAITSNMAIVPTANGSTSIFASNPTHLIVDISGYFGQ